MAYVGNSPSQQSFTGGVDQYNGNNSNTAFGLTRTINTVYDVDVYVENVWQRPTTGYTVSANTITFTSAPPSGSNNVVVVYRNFSAVSLVPQQGSVITSSLGSITNINAGSGASLTLQSNNATALTVNANGSLSVNGSIIATNINAGTNTALTLQSNNATSVTLAPTGHIGIGNGTYALKDMSGASGPQIQFGSGVIGSQGAAQTILGANYYINSSGTNSYVAAGKSARYMMSAGSHYWSAANTGTADAAISYATVMSQGGSGYSLALENASSVAGIGISFPATQSASSDANTLDDYEEGTWTPVFNNFSGTSGWTFTNAVYTKIGRVVYYAAQINPGGGALSSTSNSSYLSGLPFSISNGNAPNTWATNYIDNLGIGVTYSGNVAYSPTFSTSRTIFVMGVYQTST